MATNSLRQLLHTYGRYRADGLHHRQRAGICIVVTLLLFAFVAHNQELDLAVAGMLAHLGTDCSWCAVMPS